MADNKNQIVIKKIKKGGHGGGHGGSWKVAFADFMTAMMCFFLVMWLMGSDDETKAAIAHYFNHPNTPYKQGADKDSKEVHPMGEKEGSGDNIQTGLNGLFPDEIIERPIVQHNMMKEGKTISKMLEDLLDGKVYGMDINDERIRFSLPDSILFKAGSSELTREALADLDVVGQLLKNFNGYISIEGHTDEVSPKAAAGYANNWELSLGRALSVMHYLVKEHSLKENRITPIAAGSRRQIASNDNPVGREKNRRVEFVLSFDPPSEK